MSSETPSSRFSRLVSRFTPTSTSRGPTPSPEDGDSSDGEDVEPPEFVSAFMRATTARRRSEDGLASPIKRSPSVASAIASWGRKEGSKRKSISSETDIDMAKSPSTSDLHRPLQRPPSFEAQTTQNHSTAFHAKSTPNPIAIGVGLNESSKRFRSAFRIKSRGTSVAPFGALVERSHVAADGNASLRKPGRAPMQDQLQDQDASASDQSKPSAGMPPRLMGSGPQDHKRNSSAIPSPEDQALAKGMERVQLVQGNESSSLKRKASEQEVLRPVFNSSRLQSRLEAASLVPNPSPPPARLPTPPRLSPRTRSTPPSDVPSTQTSVDRRAAQLPPRRISPSLYSSRPQSPKSEGRPNDTKEGSPTVAEMPQRRTAGLSARNPRPASETLKLAPSIPHFDIPRDDPENIAPPQGRREPFQAFKEKQASLLANSKSYGRQPLHDLPPQRLPHSSAGSHSGPVDRIVPLKQSSASPPEYANGYQQQLAVLPDLPVSNHAAQAPFPKPTKQAQQPASSSSSSRGRVTTVNGKQYYISALLGKGGSSRVYRITDREHNVYALKRVELGKGDMETYTSFCNEINLLKQLRGHDRVIQLVDEEMNEAKRTLVMVLEIGEIDLNMLLQERVGKRVSMNFLRQTWEQMLECVKVVHDSNIVHSDLKPANFVLVKGSLKLIDFGIAKAIPNDTTNIHRDQQIGTANYMSPETLRDLGTDPDERLMKLGRPADVWSLGCILYQMVYGSTPFGRLRVLTQKMLAIQNPETTIDFPAYAIPKTRDGEELPDLATRVEGDLVRCMKSCLMYDAKQRSTIPELLEHPFLRREGSDTFRKEPALTPAAVSKIVQQTVQWSAGRRPSPADQERFVESLLRNMGMQA